MDWFDRVPKVELHLHLEGAIPYDALWTLIEKYGGDPSVPTRDALDRRFAYRDFSHFIETWVWKNQFLREYEDFTFVAEAVARDLAAQNVRYVEAFFSPSDFARHRLEPQPIAEAFRKGLDRVPGVEVALIADVVRDDGPERAAATIAQLKEVLNVGIIGIGIGGSEHRFPPEPFAAVYDEARRVGLRTSAHAGEAAGPASIWSVIRTLRVDRIGHGTRAIEDPALVDYLADRQIPLELCPISNVRTGVLPSIEAHPARQYFDRGLLITVNSDDPRMFGNSLAEEYRMLEQYLQFTRDEVRTLILNGVRASWLPEQRKARLARALTGDPSWLDRGPRPGGPA